MPLHRLLFSLLLLAAGAARAADPGYYLVTVYENEGQRSIDFRHWTVQAPGEPLQAWPEIGFGWNVTKRWYTELYVSYIYSRDQGTRPSTLNWQNDFLLTQGQYPFDLALHTVLIRGHDRNDGDALELGPALQTDVGRVQLNFNAFLDRTWRPVRAKPTQLKIQWQAKYRVRNGPHFGIQGFGELGDWDDWAPRKDQSHRAGPMVQMRWPLGDGQALQLDAAYLWGKVYGGRGRMFTMRAQYLF